MYASKFCHQPSPLIGVSVSPNLQEDLIFCCKTLQLNKRIAENNLPTCEAVARFILWPCKFTPRKFVIRAWSKRGRPTNASVNGGKYGGLLRHVLLTYSIHYVHTWTVYCVPITRPTLLCSHSHWSTDRTSIEIMEITHVVAASLAIFRILATPLDHKHRLINIYIITDHYFASIVQSFPSHQNRWMLEPLNNYWLTLE